MLYLFIFLINSIPYLLDRTWSGPAWSPAQSLSSVLISIQSLLNENPYHNEPGFEQVMSNGLTKQCMIY